MSLTYTIGNYTYGGRDALEYFCQFQENYDMEKREMAYVLLQELKSRRVCWEEVGKPRISISDVKVTKEHDILVPVQGSVRKINP